MVLALARECRNCLSDFKRRRKRILSYIVDVFISIVICAFLSIVSFIIGAILALVLLPFVASDGDTWNPILTWVMNGVLLFGALVFMLTSLGNNFKLTLTLGYKLNGLLLKNTNKLRLFTWLFMRNGIVGLFIFLIAYYIANEMDYNYLFLPLFYIHTIFSGRWDCVLLNKREENVNGYLDRC